MAHGRGWQLGAAYVILLAVALILIVVGQPSLALDGIIYVDADATGPVYDGSTWDTAFTDLQDALDAAVAPVEIWVAAGTYQPTDTTDRTISFSMKNGVAIYGGFDPSIGATEWDDRDWVSSVTILSGDIGTEGDPADNSYHVFYHHWTIHLDSSAVLNGFTIIGGNADGSIIPDHSGGGMYNNEASPTLANCTFEGNSAAVNGGGMVNHDSSPELINCTFASNSADQFGGGMFNHESSAPTLTNCAFVGNFGGYGGGGVRNEFAVPTLTNCTFSGNSSPYDGGGMSNYQSTADLTNCILWADTKPEIDNSETTTTVTYSDIQDGGYVSNGNIDADPLFVDAASGDLRLGPGSPCIDAGTNTADLPDYDFEGDARVIDGNVDGTATVDMGVDEAVIRICLPVVLKSY